MDASEAREHLEMVERIIAASSRKLEAGGEFFVAWGLAGASMDILIYLASIGAVPAVMLWGEFAILGIAIVYTVLRGRRYREKGSMSLLQREYLNVLWLTLSLAAAVNLVGFNIFTRWAGPAIWNVAEAVVLFYIGMHGNRRAQIAGIAMVLSIALANFVPAYTGLILAAGVLVGYGGFGVAELLARE